jgi:hypothetical protein
LFVYGHAMNANDDHWYRLIQKGKLRQLFIGVHGDPDSAGNRHLIGRGLQLQALRPDKNPLKVTFFDSGTANVWG